MNANDWFSNAQGNPKPFDIAHQWAGSLGGPLKKEKLFFFFDAEGIRVVLPNQQQVELPSAKFEALTMASPLEVLQRPDVAIDSIFLDHQVPTVWGWPDPKVGTPGIIQHELGVAL